MSYVSSTALVGLILAIGLAAYLGWTKFEPAQWATLLGAIIAALVVVIGWDVSNRLAADREFQNRRRDLTTQYLIDAYQKLALSANRFPKGGAIENSLPAGQYADWFEEAVAKIQLLGSPAEIAVVHRLNDAVAARTAGGPAIPVSVDELLQTVRRALRAELQLPTVDTPIRQIRVER